MPLQSQLVRLRVHERGPRRLNCRDSHNRATALAASYQQVLAAADCKVPCTKRIGTSETSRTCLRCGHVPVDVMLAPVHKARHRATRDARLPHASAPPERTACPLGRASAPPGSWRGATSRAAQTAARPRARRPPLAALRRLGPRRKSPGTTRPATAASPPPRRRRSGARLRATHCRATASQVQPRRLADSADSA